MPEFRDIQEAADRIRPFIHRTPVLRSSALDLLMGTEMWFKCENFQKVGAFKFRGAMNSVLQLNGTETTRGVATHSSGNHAAALALAAAMKGIPAFIVMPENSPAVKKKAVAGYGAHIRFCEPTLEAREKSLQEVIEETGATFIHPYNHPHVIAGQGTAAMEFLEEVPRLDVVIAPVGGGGLLSGTAIASKGLRPDIQVVAAEPLGANDASRSFYGGKWVPSTKPNTIADGLLTSLGPLTFQIIRERVDDILCVKEASIRTCLRLLMERMKIVVEPSSAVALACVLENPSYFKGKKTGIILSGGNLELDHLAALLA